MQAHHIAPRVPTGRLASFMAEHALTTAARALRAMEVLAGDLATARREAAALRGENASLRAEVERLKAGRRSEPELEALRSRKVHGRRGNGGGRSGP
jgi:cell division protein FtsB